VPEGAAVTVNPTDRLGALDWLVAALVANDTADADLTDPKAWRMCGAGLRA
jgi:hypothetical protein